jgi:tetratricopeptide (TPR) repeat protein
VEIDPGELDARYQLGRVARMRGKWDEALEHFNAVAAQDHEFSQSEVWREIGAVQAAASRDQDARAALEHYAERRPYDPEGLYYFGATLAKLGETQRAREILDQCVEAEKTNPYYRHGQMRKWRKLAEKQLRSLRE